MSVKEVTLLRKNGNLKEAYKMAIDDLKEDRNNPWAQMSLFWVLRDMCQQLFNRNDIDKAKICLKEMSLLLPTMMDDSGAGEKAYTNLYKQLQPNADAISKASELSKNDPSRAYVQAKNYIDSPNKIDSALHEDLGWIIYRYIKAEVSNLTSLEVRMLLKDYMYLKNERPSVLHSQMLNFALNFSKEHSDFSFYRFFLLWGPENLRYEDLDKSNYNGSEIQSLISRICRQIVNSGEDIDVEKLYEKINLPKSETLDLLREPQFWKIVNLHKEGKTHEMFEAFAAYNKRNAVYGASYWHSEILRIAERYMNGQDAWRFIYFFRDWGYENLMDSDWKEETDDKGNTYKPLAIKAAKRCYEYLKELHLKDAELISWLDSLYNVLIERAKKDEWLLRQRAIIYTWQQKYALAINVYKSLLLKMSDKYYIWSELADCIQDSNEVKTALLSKALLIERNEDFLGSIHLTLADLLIKQGLMSEALCELNMYKKFHDKTSPKYQEYIEQVDMSVIPPSNNKLLYNKYAAIAEEYAFSEIEAREVTLVDRWEKDGKTYCSFTNGVDVLFQVNAKRFPFLKNVKLGSVFRVKCHIEEEGMQFQTCFFSCDKANLTEAKYIPLCMHRFETKLWIGLPEKFGYVEYLNEEKKILHIVTQDSKQTFQTFKEKWGTISKGDFVRFREYTIMKKNEKKVVVVKIEKVDKETALPNFNSGIVVVDDINEQKELFHYTFGQGKIGGIIFFNNTVLRPEIGQCLKIFYCVTKDRKGEKRPIVLNVEETTEINSNAIKTIQGFLELKYKDDSWDGSPDFAFIGDYYVHRSVLCEYNITKDCYVTADIIYAGQGKWKVIKIRQ